MSLRSLISPSVVTGALVLCPAITAQQPASRQLASIEWPSLRAAYDASCHRVVSHDGAYAAHNPGQQWSTRFDGRGFATTPDAGGWEWGLELTRYGWGDQLRDVAASRSMNPDGRTDIWTVTIG